MTNPQDYWEEDESPEEIARLFALPRNLITARPSWLTHYRMLRGHWGLGIHRSPGWGWTLEIGPWAWTTVPPD